MNRIVVAFADPNDIDIVRGEWMESWVNKTQSTCAEAECLYKSYFYDEFREDKRDVIKNNWSMDETFHLAACLTAAICGRTFSLILRK